MLPKFVGAAHAEHESTIAQGAQPQSASVLLSFELVWVAVALMPVGAGGAAGQRANSEELSVWSTRYEKQRVGLRRVGDVLDVGIWISSSCCAQSHTTYIAFNT